MAAGAPWGGVKPQQEDLTSRLADATLLSTELFELFYDILRDGDGVKEAAKGAAGPTCSPPSRLHSPTPVLPRSFLQPMWRLFGSATRPALPIAHVFSTTRGTTPSRPTV